ncbi:unnamed protein product [Porites evermanni]|uniref:Uromodulin n=1 Tax=Porites evermanni TaxID=104178 RepID=A0ABN8QG71_9CNID|nr:unnamed protein product [Porites evermanni]
MTMRKLFRISVLFVLGQLLYKTVTQQCGSEVSIFGWMLQGHIYDTMLAELPHTCVQVCREDNRCQSFNWVISLLKCEFSNRTKEARPEDFISDPDRFYYKRERNRVPLGSIPELPAETCLEIKKSEGHAISRKYWFSSIKTGTSVLAYCDMTTEDIDECTSSVPLCDVNATCTNNDGSYICTCKNGFSGDGKTCKVSRVILIAVPFVFSHSVNIVCRTGGHFACACTSAFLTSLIFFLDIDECSTNSHSCDLNAVCGNTLGSYTCACKQGYSGNGRTCSDIDECSTSSHSCDVNAVCSNTVGSYACACKAGFTGDGNTCTDIDECTRGTHNCHSSLASCTNTAGSFSCSCNNPYSGDGRTCYLLVSECRNYGSLNSSDRKITYITDYRYCDNKIGPGWFRFEGSAGIRIPTSCPSTRRCGTNAPGWMNGGHPTVVDGQVTRTVCFHWTAGCCEWSTNIKVRNCGSYYVYYLHSTPNNGYCYLRYCGTD